MASNLLNCFIHFALSGCWLLSAFSGAEIGASSSIGAIAARDARAAIAHRHQKQHAKARRHSPTNVDIDDNESATTNFAAATASGDKQKRHKTLRGVLVSSHRHPPPHHPHPHHKATPERVRLHAAMPPSSRHKPQKQRLGEGGGGKLPSHQRILRDWQREHQWFVAGGGHRSTHTSAASRSKRRRPHKKSTKLKDILQQMDALVRPRFG